jgi:hypothetical protein
MEITEEHEQVRQVVEELIENGSNYRVDILDRIYHPRLKIVKIDENGNVAAISRSENMAFFERQKESQAAPLSTQAELKYVDADSMTGHVIVTRHMDIDGRPEKSVFSILLTKNSGRWQVIHETAFVQALEPENRSA